MVKHVDIDVQQTFFVEDGKVFFERNGVPVMSIKVTCGKRLYVDGDLLRFNCDSLRVGNVVMERDVSSIKFNVG